MFISFQHSNIHSIATIVKYFLQAIGYYSRSSIHMHKLSFLPTTAVEIFSIISQDQHENIASSSRSSNSGETTPKDHSTSIRRIHTPQSPDDSDGGSGGFSSKGVSATTVSSSIPNAPIFEIDLHNCLILSSRLGSSREQLAQSFVS